MDGTFTGSCVTVPFAATEDIAATLGAVAGSAGQAGWLAAEDAASQQARALGVTGWGHPRAGRWR